MKIVFIAPRYHTNQHFWVKALQNKGHLVSFVVDIRMEISEHYEATKPVIAEVYKLPKIICFLIDHLMLLQGKRVRTRLHTLPKWSFLKNQLVKQGADLVVVRDTGSTLSLVTFLVCRLHKIPCILYNQHPLEDREHRLTRILQAVGIAPKVRITPMRKDVSNERDIKQNSYYVPLISAFPYNAAERQTPTKPIKLLFIGKFTLERKKHLLLLESVRVLSKKHSIELTMVGAYHESNIKPYNDAVNFVREHKLESIVTFKQNVPYENMPELYRQHDLFVLPSVDEPFAISPLEAMNFGLPVIITDSNGARGCIQNGKTGFVIPSNDQKALTEKIQFFIYDTTNLQKASLNASKYIRLEHSEDKFYSYFKQAIRETK